MFQSKFNQDQYQSVYPKGIENHYWTLSRNKIIKSNLARARCADKKILEIGCGRGVVVNFLRQAGFDCYGVDLAEVQVGQTMGDYVKTGIDFEQLDKSLTESIEIVMLLDVIEHIEDEALFISRIKNFFPNLIAILVTVPARPEIASNYDLYHGHYRRYDGIMLTDIGKRCGLKVEKFSYFFHLLYLPARLLLMLERNRNTKISPPDGVGLIIHKFLSLIFVWDYILLPAKFFGTSAMSWFYLKR